MHGISLPPGSSAATPLKGCSPTGSTRRRTLFRDDRRPARLVAFPRFVATRSLLQFVPAPQRAWHAGESAWRGRRACNDFSIGIELEGTDESPYAAAQYTMLARLVRALRRRYPIEEVVGHSDIAPGRKTDPGPAFDWARLRRLLARPGIAGAGALAR